MKKVTCALVMIDRSGNILGCHGYGKPQRNGFDFPKGCHDETDVDHLATALRELYEETGIVLSRSSDIIDLGIHPHTREKDIHIFVNRVDKFPNLSELHCDSTFVDRKGDVVPEMDGYAIIQPSERATLFYGALQNKFGLIDTANGTGQ